MRQNGLLLREIAKHYADGEYRIPLGTLSRIDHDPNYAPHKPAVLKALGLPALAAAPVCPKCGIVPLAKRCPTCRQRAREAAFERNGREYDEWRAAHAGELAAVVEWAEKGK